MTEQPAEGRALDDIESNADDFAGEPVKPDVEFNPEAFTIEETH